MVDSIGLVIAFVIFFMFMFSGLYIHGTLLGTGIIGILLLGHSKILPGFMGYQSFPAVASYSLTTIPLFVLTAQFILQAGVVEDLYAMIYNFSRGKRGILGATTLVIGAFLGAVCGSGTATSASLGQIAYPQLVKHGYNKELAAAVSAAAGSLSSIIPPSVVIIVYGVATETPIGKLFVGAILPGIAVTLVYILCNAYFLSGDKSYQISHNFERIPIPRRQSITVLLVGVTIAVIIFGGIYSGFMTPTEAGAVGAFTAFLAALILKKVNMKFLVRAASETSKVTCMIMVILIGAKIFGKFITLSMIARKFIALLNPLFDFPLLILGILVVIYFFLFMFLEGTAVILMTTPILIPLMKAMNVDTLWFGILVCVTCVIGMLTPPVGLCVYTVSGITKLPVEGVFRYGIVFAAVCSIVVGALLIFVPEIVTWLPNTMSGR